MSHKLFTTSEELFLITKYKLYNYREGMVERGSGKNIKILKEEKLRKGKAVDFEIQENAEVEKDDREDFRND